MRFSSIEISEETVSLRSLIAYLGAHGWKPAGTTKVGAQQWRLRGRYLRER
jgi:hypothetical protein